MLCPEEKNSYEDKSTKSVLADEIEMIRLVFCLLQIQSDKEARSLVEQAKRSKKKTDDTLK